MEGLRNSPLTEGRGFNGLEERVLLPLCIVGSSETRLIGLGDLCVDVVKFGDWILEDVSDD